LALIGGAANASADLIPYGNVGTPNPTTYTFTAAASGDITAYFAGASAGYDNEIGMLDNGVLTSAGYGLDDHSSSIGQSFDLGFVNAGDTLTFVLDVLTIGQFIYSDPSLNGPYDAPGETANGHNHVYSTAYSGTVPIPQPGGGSIPVGIIPAGTYVAFEDLPFNGLGASVNGNSDFDYNDETYIFTDVATTTNTVPDSGSSLTLLGIGCVGVGLLRRRLCGSIKANENQIFDRKAT
jgi:hypothetical protein